MTVVAAETYTASVVLPYPHASCATAGLRAELRHRVIGAAGGQAPDWSTLLVTGPRLDRDARGRLWFEYTAVLGVGGAAAREHQPRG
jgi:hypothetical protein